MKKNLLFMFVIFFTACSLFESEWDKAKKENNRTAYVDFIVKNPQSEYVKEAQEKIDSLNWSIFYFLLPNVPSFEKIISFGTFIPQTNMSIEVITLSLIPQISADVPQLISVFGKPDSVVMNNIYKETFAVPDKEGKKFDIAINYSVIPPEASVSRPWEFTIPDTNNIEYDKSKCMINRYGRFDLLTYENKVKQVIINFLKGSIEKEKIDTTHQSGWVFSSGNAMSFSRFNPEKNLINASDYNKIFAKDELRK